MPTARVHFIDSQGDKLMYSQLIALRILELCRQRGLGDGWLKSCPAPAASAIKDILSGKCKDPDIFTLHKIASAFHLTLAEFMDFPEMNEYVPDEEDEV